MSRAKALQWLARLGYGSLGIVYLVLGWLASTAALSDTRPPSLRGALTAIVEHRFGWLALGAIAGGLFGYAAWRATEAVLDLQGEGSDARGLAVRAAMLASAALYLGFGVIAAAVVADWDEIVGGARGGVVEAWAALVLAWPFGRWLVGLVGAGTLVMGVAEVIKARGSAFKDIRAPAAAMRLIRPLGWFGLAAKGVVFGLVGILLATAAWQAEANEAGGVRAALAALDAAPVGDRAFLAVAAGLAGYGVFGLVKGWYHRLPPAS